MSRKVQAFKEEFAPRRKEEGGKLLRQDGVWVLTWERTYTLLTPLFGGGVEPRKADPVGVVRATEVRGHLRFWWRALRGWQSQGSVKRLLELESAIFGSAGEGGASPLAVEVEVLKEGEDVEVAQYGRAIQWYLGFPLREAKGWTPVKKGVAFRLRLRFPERVGHLDMAQELEAALWAWETFGGIGARTRRGFGALSREGSRPPREEDVRERLRRYSRQEGWPEGVPHLTPQSLVRVVPLSWKEVAERYQAFRQARTRKDPRNPGRSLWPEPDEIRRLTGKHLPQHAPRHSVRKFPRAQFGLPIIFHFKDRGDPPDTTLNPHKDIDRRASPLLFRPLAERLSVVAVLEGPRFPEKKLLLEADRRAWEVDPWLTLEEAREISPLRGQVDPVRAFVESL